MTAAKAGISKRTATQALVEAEPKRKRSKPPGSKVKPQPEPKVKPTADLQEAIFTALDEIAEKLAATGHGKVTIKTVVAFEDGTRIQRTTTSAEHHHAEAQEGEARVLAGRIPITKIVRRTHGG